MVELFQNPVAVAHAWLVDGVRVQHPSNVYINKLPFIFLMTEIECMFECAECDAMFDDMDDGKDCVVCSEYICENCQEVHGKDHCFEECDCMSLTKKVNKK